MNLTLSLDERVVQQARAVARSLGKSLNQLVREYLENLTRGGDAERDMEEIRRLSEQGQGRSRGWNFEREDLHGRS